MCEWCCCVRAGRCRSGAGRKGQGARKVGVLAGAVQPVLPVLLPLYQLVLLRLSLALVCVGVQKSVVIVMLVGYFDYTFGHLVCLCKCDWLRILFSIYIFISKLFSRHPVGGCLDGSLELLLSTIWGCRVAPHGLLVFCKIYVCYVWVNVINCYFDFCSI